MVTLRLTLLLELIARVPGEEVILMKESEFNATPDEITGHYWHNNCGRFVHSTTGDSIVVKGDPFVECMDLTEPLKRFVILEEGA